MARAAEDAQVIVHLAALTDVDACEADPERATEVNVGGTKAVMDAARGSGAYVVYLSTDYVFDGKTNRPYVEDDAPAPLSVYGGTKFSGEQLVAGYEPSLIVRSQWVFGAGPNFVATILRAARSGKPLRVVDDQRGIPTPAAGLAAALASLIDSKPTGIIHVSGDGPVVSWAEFAAHALDVAGIETKVQPVTTEEYVAAAGKTIAPRPAFSALDLGKARGLGVPLLDWRTGLKAYIGENA